MYELSSEDTIVGHILEYREQVNGNNDSFFVQEGVDLANVTGAG